MWSYWRYFLNVKTIRNLDELWMRNSLNLLICLLMFFSLKTNRLHLTKMLSYLMLFSLIYQVQIASKHVEGYHTSLLSVNRPMLHRDTHVLYLFTLYLFYLALSISLSISLYLFLSLSIYLLCHYSSFLKFH